MIQQNKALKSLLILMIMLSIVPIVVSAAPPSVSSISSATYTENDQMTIDSAISVTGDEAVSDAKVSIGTGYVSSEDSLTYITTNGVTGSFSTGTGILSLTGGSLPSDYQAAFRNVKYYNNKDNPNTNQRVITFAIGNSLYYLGTGHYYEFVESGITWDAARTAADARRLYGLQGYLATITSAGENDFIQSKVAGDAWIGASDSSGESAWRWMTGPEGTEESGLGRRFWQGTGGGSVIGGYYNKWASGEPNDYNSGSPGEDYAYMISNQGGTWNDYPTARSLSYFTEYGGRAGDPVLNLTATVTVNVTAINDAPITPGAFTSPTTGQTKTGSQPITVIWGSSTDPDGDTVKYDLWYFNGTWTQIGDLLTGTSMIYNLSADNTNSAMFRVYANDTVLNSSARDVTFTVDTTAPTFTIQYYSDSGLTASLGDRPKLKAGTYYIKITSSEALSGTPTISIDAEGTANDETSDATSTVSGNDYRYTRTIASDAAAVGSLLEEISITGTDAASNTAANVNPTNEATKAAYTDTTAPTLTSAVFTDNALKIGQTSPVTFTFSEAISGFTNTDLTIANGGLTALSSEDGNITWTATFTPADDIEAASNTIAVAMNGVTDTAGNAGFGSTNSSNYAIDTKEPTFTIQYYSDTNLATSLGDNPQLKEGTYYIKITSSETLSGTPTISIEAEGTANDETNDAVAVVSGNDYRYIRTIASDAAAVGSLLEDISITGTDAASNTAANVNPTNEASKAAYIDTTAPTVTITMDDAALNVGDTSTVTFTFSEAPTGFTTDDITVGTGTIGVINTTNPLIQTAIYTPTDNVDVGTNVITVGTGWTDAALNTGVGDDSPNYAVDTIEPTVTVTMDDAALNIGDTSTVTFTFSEAPTGFTTDDVTVGTGTIGVINITNPLIQTAIYTPTDNVDVGTNVITVSTVWTDAAGNAGVGNDSSNYAVDTIEPTVTVTMDDAALNVGDTSTVTFTFSEVVSGFANADLTIANGGLTAVSSADGNITWTATFTPTNDIEAAINVIALAMTGVTDTAGNAGLGSTDSSNYAIDTKEPTFTILYYSDTNLATSLGDNPKLKAGTYYIKITSSESLSGTPTISINTEGTANDVTVEATVAVSGNDYRYTRTIATDAAAVGSLLEDISITGTDAASNTATNVNPTDEASKAAYIDTIAPSITIISPVNMTYNNTSIVLDITTNQTVNVTFSLNGGTNQSLYNMTTSGSTSITGMEGANNIAVYANDPAGNPNSNIVYFIVDKTAPSLSITRVTSPTNITYQNITGTVSDTGGVGIGTVTVNGIAATNGTGYFYYNLTGLELGNNTITVIATDLADNVAINATYILVIPEVPAITSYAPSSSVSDPTGATRTFNISIDQVVNVTWYLNGTYLYTNTSVTEANYTNSSAGSGIWNVTAIVNNTNGTDFQKWTWIVMADNTPPVITISVPTNNENLSIFDRIISGSITDDSAITANMYVNSVFTNTWASKGSFRWSYNFTNGTNTINISATDAYNNINRTNISVFVLSPVNEASVNLTVNQSVNITANASTGVDVFLSTGNTTANVTVKINASINASHFNVSDIDTEFVTLGIAKKSLVRFVEINATGDVVNLSSVKITMFYNDSDLDLNGNGKIDAGDIKEDTLNLYWYRDNATSGSQEWFPLTLGADYSGKLDRQNNSGPIVISVEKNTAFNYISVSTNHFSFYSIAGASIPATTTTITGSGGGGSGGSGVVTAEPSENIALAEMIERNLEIGKPVTYTFTQNQDIVYEVSVTGKEYENNVAMRIEILKNRSKQAKENAPGFVYGNVNIILGTKNIGEKVIKFKVKDSWLMENGLDSSDIRLVEWVDNKWILLETGVLFNKDGYTHFSAKSTTFSIYAITGIKKEDTAPATEKTAVTPEVTPLPTEEKLTRSGGKTPLWMWLIPAVLIIAALVYALKRR